MKIVKTDQLYCKTGL